MNIQPINIYTETRKGRHLSPKEPQRMIAGDRHKHGAETKDRSSATECVKESAVKRHNKSDKIQYKYEQINTSITENPDARVSFKGGTPFIHRAANFVSDNPLVADALFALAITCGLRPATIMATAKTEEDKEKCAYQAAKSVSSGVVGLGMTALVGMPIAAATKAANKKGAFAIPQEMKQKAADAVKPGVEALKEKAAEIPEIAGIAIKDLIEGDKINSSVIKKAGKGAEKRFLDGVKEKLPDAAEKIGKAVKEQKVLDNYAKTGKNVADKLFQPIFMPLRATVTIAMVPVILGLLGLKKPSKKPDGVQDAGQNPFKNVDLNFGKRTQTNIFENFSGDTNKCK